MLFFGSPNFLLLHGTFTTVSRFVLGSSIRVLVFLSNQPHLTGTDVTFFAEHLVGTGDAHGLPGCVSLGSVIHAVSEFLKDFFGVSLSVQRVWWVASCSMTI